MGRCDVALKRSAGLRQIGLPSEKTLLEMLKSRSSHGITFVVSRGMYLMYLLRAVCHVHWPDRVQFRSD